ncbi:MAG: hypothetical protein V7704_18780, partial [Aurantimonas endophytica]|uniref:hypothetical protein n=1 Tax=Aurantimonas endophytica TaxID=1522175 RepID=UPI00300149DD
ARWADDRRKSHSRGDEAEGIESRHVGIGEPESNDDSDLEPNGSNQEPWALITAQFSERIELKIFVLGRLDKAGLIVIGNPSQKSEEEITARWLPIIH